MQFSHLCGWVPTCSNWQDFCLWSGRVTDWVVILIEILTGLRDLEFTDINWGSQGPTRRVCQLWFGSGVEEKISSGRVLSCIEILIGYASSISLISYFFSRMRASLKQKFCCKTEYFSTDLHQHSVSSAPRPDDHVCIVGAGPAGDSNRHLDLKDLSQS